MEETNNNTEGKISTEEQQQADADEQAEIEQVDEAIHEEIEQEIQHQGKFLPNFTMTLDAKVSLINCSSLVDIFFPFVFSPFPSVYHLNILIYGIKGGEVDSTNTLFKDHKQAAFYRIIPLYKGLGTHYFDLWVGCPNAVRQTVVLDTGSGITAFPCDGCTKDCGGSTHTDKVYQTSKSQCFHDVMCGEMPHNCLLGGCSSQATAYETCIVSHGYVEGSSWAGKEVVDRVYSGGDHFSEDMDMEKAMGFDLIFACLEQESRLFKTQMADGITGMANVPSSYWRQLHNAGEIKEKKFSVCYASTTRTPEQNGTLAGAMVLGGCDRRLHLEPMEFAELQPDSSGNGHYLLQIEQIYLQSNNAADSGATAAVVNGQTGYQRVATETDALKLPVMLDSGNTCVRIGFGTRSCWFGPFKGSHTVCFHPL